MLRAIYTGDVRFNECNVFKYNLETKKFHMINDNEISYPFEVVMNDRDFVVFASDGDAQGHIYRIENQNVNEYYNE